jgi:hypothetical protein
MSAIDDLTAETALAHAKAGELLGPMDLAAILHLKKSRFHALAKAGQFDHLKTKPALGPRCYSGVLVTKWLAGEVVDEPTRFFGRKRGVR